MPREKKERGKIRGSELGTLRVLAQDRMEIGEPLNHINFASHVHNIEKTFTELNWLPWPEATRKRAHATLLADIINCSNLLIQS